MLRNSTTRLENILIFTCHLFSFLLHDLIILLIVLFFVAAADLTTDRHMPGRNLIAFTR